MAVFHCPIVSSARRLLKFAMYSNKGKKVKRVVLGVADEITPVLLKGLSLEKSKSMQHFGSFATEEKQTISTEVVVPLSTK